MNSAPGRFSRLSWATWLPLMAVALLLLALAVEVRSAGWVALAVVAVALVCCVWLGVVLWKQERAARVRAQGRDRHQQAAILKLLDEMGPLADGDLSVRATVDESMTGALADAFNHAVSELRWLVGAAVGSAQTVREAVQSARKPMRALASGASVQSREVLRSSNYLGAMSGVMTELSLNAGESARQSRDSREAMSRCLESLTRAQQEFARIRDESSLTTRLTSRLAENLRAIDVESAAVEAVSARTDLLALNTTVRAAVASGGGGPTGDYSRLSDDVADLARQLDRASRQIGALTDAIREDADEILRAMSSTDAALGTGVGELDAMRGELEAIESSAGGLESIVGETAESATRQARVVGRVSGNMTVIDRISREGAQGTLRVAAALDELQALADDLERSVSGFRLPTTPAPSVPQPLSKVDA